MPPIWIDDGSAKIDQSEHAEAREFALQVFSGNAVREIQRKAMEEHETFHEANFAVPKGYDADEIVRDYISIIKDTLPQVNIERLPDRMYGGSEYKYFKFSWDDVPRQNFIPYCKLIISN
jgi:hypothetical protein